MNDEHSTNEPPRAIRFVTEAVLGLALAAAVTLAILASTGEIPFVYQGY